MTSSNQEYGRDLQARLDSLTTSDVPGIAVVETSEQGTFGEHAAGWARFDERRPMTAHTIGNLFSTTKLVTATAVMQLHERWNVDLDLPILEYLPDQHLRDGSEGRITVRQLLSHTSGLPDPAPIFWIHRSEEPGPSLTEFTNRLLARHGRVRFEPGTKSSYSSIGYLVLGCLIERVSGLSYQAYVRDHILRPLRMTRTYFAYPDDTVGDVGRGHEKAASALGIIGRFVYWRVITRRYGSYLEYRPFLVDGAPYGGLVGTAADLSRFLAAHLRGGELEGQRILDPASVAEMLKPVRGRDGRPVLPLRASRRPELSGLGWHLDDTDGKRFAYHLGGGGGFLSDARIYPDLGYGVTVLGNVTTWNIDEIVALGVRAGIANGQ